MTFHIITIFPDSLKSYIQTSILRKAQALGKIKIKFYNPRDFTALKRRQARPTERRQSFGRVDDRAYGGGAGMVLKAEPILKTVEHIKRIYELQTTNYKLVILSAKGKLYNQKLAVNWAKIYDHLILIAGRYEGIDERVRKILRAQEISVGPYVLTDGELPAMLIVCSVARLIPGVIRCESLEEESYWNAKIKNETKTLLEHPHFTRPEVLVWRGKNYKVPKVLLSGHHRQIKNWRQKMSKTLSK